MADPAAARSRLLMRLRAAALGAGAAVAWSVLAAGPAAAHEVSDRTGGSSSDPRPVAVGLALVAVAALSGPLFTGAGRVGRVRAAVARLATAGSLVVLAAVPLRPAAAVAAVAAAAVVLAFPGRRLSVIPAAVVLATVAGGGAGGSSAVDRLADCLHVVAAGGWIGAVVEVAVAWRRDPSSGRRAARRVAAPAAGLLAVVVATGSVAAAEHLGDARNALGTGWGRALVAKVSLVALAAAGGAWLRRAWVPRVEASVLAVVAMGGLVLAAVGGPVSGELLPGPLFVARQGASVAVVPLAPGRNTVVVRAGDLRAVTVEVDGRPVALRAGAGGFGTAAVELRAGRHRVRALGKTTEVTVARSHGPTVLRARLPAAGNDPDCLDRLAGATAGAAALTRAGHPVRVEVSIGDGPCRVSGQPVPAWDAVDVLLDALAHRRGAAGPPVLVTGGDRRGARLANALSARRPGTTTSAAGTIGAGGGGPIVIATSRDQARAAVAAALRSTGGEAPVVLAPWLLDATLLADLADDRAPVLVAATRDPTSVAALDYRRSTTSLPGGIPPTAAGFEGYLAVLASAAGTSVAPPAPGMFSMSRVGILPASFDVGHGTPAGWSPGVALVRVL